MFVRIARAAVRYSGLVAALRRLRHVVPILCYHNVVGEDAASLGDVGAHMPVEEFREQMEWLRLRYRVVPLEELLANPSRGSWRGVAAITFDDGYLGMFRHGLPVLEALDLPATLFIVGDAPGSARGFWWDDPEVVRRITPADRKRWLSNLGGDAARIRSEVAGTGSGLPGHEELLPASWETIRESLGNHLFDLGAHSMTHRALSELDAPSLEKELVDSRDVLERNLGRRPSTFAYPYGSWNAQVHDAARRVGYRAGLTLDDRPATTRDSRWGLPRLCIPSGLPLNAFAAWLVDIRRS